MNTRSFPTAEQFPGNRTRNISESIPTISAAQFNWKLAMIRLGRITTMFFAVWLLLPTSFLTAVGSGLDASWQISLALAYRQGLVFGSDFVFTYGPLGFLSTRLPFEELIILQRCSDIFVFSSLILVLSLVLIRTNTTAEWLCTLGAIFCFGPGFYGVDLVIVLFFSFLFLISLYLERDSKTALALAAILSLFCFYTKSNLGLAALLIMTLSLGQAVLSRKGYVHTLLLLTFYFLGLASSAWALNVDLFGYVKTSLHIANGYNDAMVLEPTTYVNYVPRAVAICAALVIFCFSNMRCYLKEKSAAVCLVSSALFTFLLFKQAFVRADEHVFIFFQFALLPLGLLYLFAPPIARSAAAKLFVITLLLAFPTASERFNLEYFKYKYDGFKNYLADFSKASASYSLLSSVPDGLLPKEILEAVGTTTVDIIPSEISHLYHAGLNYEPRPVIQSYLAYDAYLDGINAAKYLSPSAPRHIVFAGHCIDNRYCFFDESKTKLAILSRYDPIMSHAGWTLLRLNDAARHISEESLLSGSASLKQRIRLPDSDKLIFFKSDIQYSLLGYLSRIFYQPPQLTVKFHLENGGTLEHRAILPIINSGVAINRFISNTDDVRSFFSRRFSELRRVRSVSFQTGKPWGFKRNFTYELIEQALEEAPQMSSVN